MSMCRLDRDRFAKFRHERGVALLSVVVVLSTLLIVGVLFAFTVDLDLKAARYYRDAGHAEQVALEGLHRSIAELQYDMWGVNEKRAFLLADSTAQLKDAAYRTNGSGLILKPRSKWRRSVERIGPHRTLTDYRWVENLNPNTLAADHSGGIYHDEFLPEGVDNSDAWQLGLHVNRGGIYFEGVPPRSYRTDEKGSRGEVYRARFWSALRNKPWDRQWDYIETRINGDSFFKIFRFELVDPVARTSTYAGVRGGGSSSPGTLMDRGEWARMKTHLGNASFPGGYANDTRGGAVNLNQVNNDYSFETYYAQEVADPAAPYVPFHYNDSKWVYIYGETGAKRGRYAVLVWPDGGTPNANYQIDHTEILDGHWYVEIGRRAADYFRILDTVSNPRGGPIAAQNFGGAAGGANIIKSDKVKGGTEGDWALDLGRRINIHIDDFGPIASRAEFNMLLRKDGLIHPDPAAVENDAEIIGSLVSVHAYENLMGPHWEQERIVLDALGFENAADRGTRLKPGNAEWKDSSFVSNSPAGQMTRRQIWHTLNDLRFYWGPDDAREGDLTPYHDDGPTDDEAKVAKSRLMSWVAAGPGRKSGGVGGSSNIGWAADASSASNPTFVGNGAGAPTRDPRLGDLNATSSHSWPWVPAINEVGKFEGADLGRLQAAVQTKNCAGKDLLTNSSYGYIEFVDQWDECSNACSYYRFSKLRLYIDGKGDVFDDPSTVLLCIDTAGFNDARHAGQKPGDKPKIVAGSQRGGAQVRSYSGWRLGKVDANNESWGRFLPANYALVLFDPAKYDGTRITLAADPPDGGKKRVVDYVELEDVLTRGWSCYDFRNNQHPKMWVRTDNDLYDPATNQGLATPAWRGLKAGGAEWHHGLNANYVMTYLPGGESYQPGYAVIDADGRGKAGDDRVTGLRGSGRDDASWVALGVSTMTLSTAASGKEATLDSWGRFLAMPLGFFPRPRAEFKGWLRPGTDRPEPFLRMWADLMSLAPVERYFTVGYLGQKSADISKHGEFIIYDSFDNDMDGHTDDMVQRPRFPGAEAYVKHNLANGHYVGDGTVVGRINLNELSHPAAIWYASVGAERKAFQTKISASSGGDSFMHQNVIVGRKPLKGYTCWADVLSRSCFGRHGYINNDVMPYQVMVWYENLFADASSKHSNNYSSLSHIHHEVKNSGRYVFVGNSPVYTVYVTAQTLDDSERPLAEIKVRCTLERTWDGKTNLLDFRWIPVDVQQN